MRSDDLTREQAQALKNKLQPMLRYLGRLKRRMNYKGFPPEDPMLVGVCDAENAIHALTVKLHYLSCGDVVGPSRTEDR
jgi:hypothetical protein